MSSNIRTGCLIFWRLESILHQADREGRKNDDDNEDEPSCDVIVMSYARKHGCSRDQLSFSWDNYWTEQTCAIVIKLERINYVSKIKKTAKRGLDGLDGSYSRGLPHTYRPCPSTCIIFIFNSYKRTANNYNK